MIRGQLLDEVYRMKFSIGVELVKVPFTTFGYDDEERCR